MLFFNPLILGIASVALASRSPRERHGGNPDRGLRQFAATVPEQPNGTIPLNGPGETAHPDAALHLVKRKDPKPKEKRNANWRPYHAGHPPPAAEKREAKWVPHSRPEHPPSK